MRRRKNMRFNEAGLMEAMSSVGVGLGDPGDLARRVNAAHENVVMGMWGYDDEGEVYDHEVEVMVGLCEVENLDGMGSELDLRVEVRVVLFRDGMSRIKWERERYSQERENYVMGMARVLNWRRGKGDLEDEW